MIATTVATLGVPRSAWAVSPVRLAGALEGRVSDDSGKPQIGAVVQLYNRQERILERRLTDEEGFFIFAGLVPDIYSIQVTMATFLPAIRNQIHIEAGKSSLLDINLSGLFSSIRLLPPVRRGDGLMNDDWKWVLRSSSTTSPVFRYLPQDPSTLATSQSRPAIFTGSRGLVSFSAGDTASSGAPGEVGTAFAFSTNVLGANRVELAGDVGYGISSESPSAAVRTTFSRPLGDGSPTVSVTMRQMYVPRWESSVATGSIPAAMPPIRSMSVNFSDRARLSDSIDVEYGVDMDTISFVDRVHYFSPYARLTYAVGGTGAGNAGTIDVTYTSGNSRPELGTEDSIDPNLALQRDVAALSTVAPVTLRSGKAKVQRGENYEIGYTRRIGSREWRISGYRESVQNAALMMAGVEGGAFSGDLIPDLYTDSLLFNAGNFHTMGYTASVTQKIGDNYQVSVSYGSVGVLAPASNQLRTGSPDELRSLIQQGQRDAASVRVSGTVPRAGTHFVASYQLLDNHAATAGHLYATDSNLPEPGLNFAIHQPIPSILGLPFRMEATIDLRNLLAEGYLPIFLPDGQQALLVHTPRSLRGGLNFRF